MTPQYFEHLVIGAGLSGLAIAHGIQRDGATSLAILDRSSEPGGVWANNRYPGCSCDVPSYLYALEDMPAYPWSRRFPERAEIHDYIKHCFQVTGLERKLRLGTAVERLAWVEEESCWQVECAGGDIIKARFVYAATGQVPRPTVPALDGLEGFRGNWFHSSEWPSELDISGLRVGVVGTGASGVQMVSGIASTARKLTVFQRNAPYLFPRKDREFFSWEKRFLHRSALSRRLYRGYLYWKHELNGIAYFNIRFLLNVVRYNTMRQIRRYLPSAAQQKEATPTYAPGCKRVLVNDDYYPTLGQPHVQLVTDAIARVDGHDLVCADGSRHSLDVLVLATGFDGTRPMPGIEVFGRKGVSLHEQWDEAGVSAFYGTQVPFFPNLFLLIGPNVGLAHNSVLYMMESQVGYIRRIVAWAREAGRIAEIRSDANSKFEARISKLLASTPWQTGGCTSWYHDKQNKNVGLWPTYTFRYRSEIRSITPDLQKDFSGH